jgi:hypothetical protein
VPGCTLLLLGDNIQLRSRSNSSARIREHTSPLHASLQNTSPSHRVSADGHWPVN